VLAALDGGREAQLRLADDALRGKSARGFLMPKMVSRSIPLKASLSTYAAGFAAGAGVAAEASRHRLQFRSHAL
jgi:hypothetical protein